MYPQYFFYEQPMFFMYISWSKITCKFTHKLPHGDLSLYVFMGMYIVPTRISVFEQLISVSVEKLHP